MAKFELQLPKEILQEIQKIQNNCDQIFGEMTKAGAEVVLSNVKANLPPSLKDSDFANHIFLSRQYKTPSDDGINTKVMISGYFTNRNGVRTPAPLVANVFEYGRSAESRSGEFQKRPFFRKSFKNAPIEAAMYAAQKKASGGLLDE